MGFESHGLWRSRVKAQGGHLRGGDSWLLPTSQKGGIMICGQVSALFLVHFLAV